MAHQMVRLYYNLLPNKSQDVIIIFQQKKSEKNLLTCYRYPGTYHNSLSSKKSLFCA